MTELPSKPRRRVGLIAIAASLVEGGPRTRDLGGNGDTKTVGAAIAELVKTV